MHITGGAADGHGRLALFCFPYAGGGASAYAGWQQALASRGARVDVRPVQLPGREDRAGEPRFTDLGALAEHVDEVLDGELARPHVLYGHSMGALIAYALTLRRQGRNAPLPLALVIGAHRAPHVPPNRILDPDASDDELAERLAGIGGMPRLLRHRRTFLANLLPLVRDDLRLCAGTGPVDEAHAIRVPLHLFAGRDDALSPPAHVAAWAEHARAGAGTHLLPGGHFFIQSHSDVFLTALAALLREYQARPRVPEGAHAPARSALTRPAGR